MTDETSDYNRPGVAVQILAVFFAVAVVLSITALDFGVTCGIVTLGWYVLNSAGLVAPLYLKGVLAIGLCAWVSAFIIKSMVKAGSQK